MSAKIKITLLLLFLIGMLVGGLIYSQLDKSHQPIVPSTPQQEQVLVSAGDRPLTTLRDFNKAFVDIARNVNPTVVTVFTEKVFKVRREFGDLFSFENPFEDFFGDFFGQKPYRRPEPEEKEYRQRGLGSGVIVSKEGYILTNNHVVEGADTVNIRIVDKRILPVKIIGADPKTDIAVIKVDVNNIQSIKMGDSDRLQVGEWVLAVGSPLSENLAHTVTSGIVSAKGRSEVGLAEYEDFIQTDAAINPGNSGGAMVNLNGELVGINTAIASRTGGFQGIGFAVPVNMAKKVMDSILKHGTVIRGWLGLYIQDIDETMAKAMDLPTFEGVMVADVTKDGPADKAGLKQGDVILELDGKKVADSARLRNIIATMAPGTKVTLKILRNGKEKNIIATLGKLETEKIVPETEERLEELFGLQVAPFDQEMAEKYRLDKSLKGVVVTKIDPYSPAHRAGLNEGDLIIAVNRKKLESIEEFNDMVLNLKKGDVVLFQVIRQNRSFYVAFKL